MLWRVGGVVGGVDLGGGFCYLGGHSEDIEQHVAGVGGIKGLAGGLCAAMNMLLQCAFDKADIWVRTLASGAYGPRRLCSDKIINCAHRRRF